jgi:hypothetical protein
MGLGASEQGSNMAQSRMDGMFETRPCPFIGNYNIQRFKQWSPEDSANFYMVKGENTKEPYAMFPTLGRAHINYLGINQLVFGSEPRGLFKSINYCYVVVGNTIFRIDSNFNMISLTGLETISGNIYFTFLVVNSIVFSCFVDSQKIYIYQENVGGLQVVTDPNAPGNFTIDGQLTKPGFIAAFGNRITVSVLNSSQFVLSVINLNGSSFNPATCFTNATTPQIFALESGIIRQMGVLNNTLYIFTDYTTGIWSNTPAVFSGTQVSFPWKKNSTYDWNFGIANSSSLDIDFGYMVFLARNSDGLLQFMVSNGGQPERMSTKAIDTLLQRYTNLFGQNNPFLVNNSNGFLYQYENTIFYRMSGGDFHNDGILDQEQTANCIEYSFEVQEWHRCIELNGERNRVQLHVYFNFMHLVTLVDDSTVYNLSGQFYYNEIRNVLQEDPQASDAYIIYPMRYERVTPIIYEKDYSEFETEYVQIDFVFGDSNIVYSTAPFSNAQFLIDEQLLNSEPQYLIAEQADSDNQPVFMLAEVGNTPSLNDRTYNTLFKPSIELFFSDDGGISFSSDDVRQFSQMGVYSWRMRWYQLGPSRNRCYKLICVSPVPIVILGSTMSVRRISGPAN